jgi:predicted SAM-dependent methyltransferase
MSFSNNRNLQMVKGIIPKPLYDPLLNLFYKFRSIGYAGDQFYCPVCSSGLRSFKAGLCPYCGSGKRHRTMWMFLLKKTDLFTKNLKVLHFAPEHCLSKPMKKLTNLKYLSADLDSPRAMIKLDMTNITFSDNSFDVVLSSHVLEHVNNDIRAMEELFRIQKSTGWSIHLVPIDHSLEVTFEDPAIITPEERNSAYGHYDHKRIYGRDYKKRLMSVGFRVEVCKTKDFCSEDEILKMGLFENTEIYYCRKD